MKKLLLLLFLPFYIYGATVIEFAGDKNYPPYSYEENGIAKGVYVDILKAAFEQIEEYEIKFNMMAWKRAIIMIKKGTIPAFFPPYYSDERISWIKFSEPILAETTILFAQEKTLKGKKRYPEDFYGLTACLNRGFSTLTLGGEEFTEAIKQKKITLVEGNDNKACLNRVSKGLADFYINDQLIDISEFQNINKGLTAQKNFGHVGFTLKSKKYPFINDLENKLNEVINTMKSNGQIDQIINKYK